MWNETKERTNGGFLIKAYEPMLLHISIASSSSSSEEDRQGVFSVDGVSVAATTTTLYPSSMPGIDRIEFECSIYPEHIVILYTGQSQADSHPKKAESSSVVRERSSPLLYKTV